MDEKILKNISENLDSGKRIALAIITKSEGSTPRKSGTIMAVNEDRELFGTIGGGAIENSIINKCMEALDKESGMNFEYKLDKGGSIKMTCGGNVEGYIKVFMPKPRLIVFGGGHISQSIMGITETMNFNRIVIEDREEFKDFEAFKNIDKFLVCDNEEDLKGINFKDSYIVLATRGHVTDSKWLKILINKDYKYIGVLGSRKKVKELRDGLLKEGIDEKTINKVYMPIGLDISDGTPEEIAFSILGEILQVKNKGTLTHLKDK
ncbi:XdhC family protein [Clostridium chrysemydis]|uniref:XdhC family protein n=1 Tax=Clostridium chrysemydis TaxID=2665504 RepID=UPI00188476ED|nr:XdhC/CoxI family protein [Clostridium chrysemydis]